MSEKRSYQELKEEYKNLKAEYLYQKDDLEELHRQELLKLKDDYYLKRKLVKAPLDEAKYQRKLERKQKYRLLNDAPKRGLLEEIGNSVSHGAGAILGLVYLVLMLLKVTEPLHIVAVTIYGFCIIAQMLFSCLYHAFKAGSTVKRIFRRFDYCSIYLAIGGTLTPLYLIYMPTMWNLTIGLIFFITQWVIIATGITFVAVFGPGRLRPLHFTLYFVIGWAGLVFVPDWIKNNLPLFIWILSGGLVYTFGMIPFAALKKKPVAHFIFHLVVLLGTICMWTGIYLYVL